MSFNSNKTAIVIIDYDNPSSKKDIARFLFNIANDKNVINLSQPLRFLIAKFIQFRNRGFIQQKFDQIKSFDSEMADSSSYLAFKLEKEISHHGNFKVFLNQIYQNDFSQNISKIIEYNPNNIILLPCFPQFSPSKLQSYFEKFDQIYNQNINSFDKKICLSKVYCYGDEDFYINSHSNLIKKLIIANIAKINYHKITILFISDILIKDSIKSDDPYFAQIDFSAKLIIEDLNKKFSEKNVIKFNYKICHQLVDIFSNCDFKHELKQIKINKEIPILVPLTFITDRFKILADLQYYYENLCKKIGIKQFLFCPTIKNDHLFLQGLLDLCLKIKKNSAKKSRFTYCGSKMNKLCSKNYSKCPNYNDYN